MSDEDPRPLKAAGDSPPELVSALRALTHPERDAERLARVAKKLGAAIGDAPPGMAVSKLGTLKTWLTSLVIAVAALGFGYYWVSGRAPQQPPNILPEPSMVPAAVSVADAPVGTEADAQRAALEPSSVAAEAESRRRPKRRAPHASSMRLDVAPRANAPVDEQSVDEVRSSSETASDEGVDPSDRQIAEDRPVVAPPQPRSEFALLLEARENMQTRPLAALRVLDEHASRYPRGQLGPEREVLAIEALQKLGRSAEAARRMQRFRSGAPDSLYLRRLQGDGGAR